MVPARTERFISRPPCSQTTNSADTGRHKILASEMADNVIWEFAVATAYHDFMNRSTLSTTTLELSADGVHAYITERYGDLVKVSLSPPNRASATVIAS